MGNVTGNFMIYVQISKYFIFIPWRDEILKLI